VYRDIPREFKSVIEPVVEDHGLELVDIERAGGKNAILLRITVDTPALDGRVNIERCAELSREVGTLIEASGIIEGAYRLEVSSPGLDRKLSREKDFAAACGSSLLLETRMPLDGRKRFQGVLKEVREGAILLELEGREVSIPFSEVRKANKLYEFSRADFAGPQCEREVGEPVVGSTGRMPGHGAHKRHTHRKGAHKKK